MRHIAKIIQITLLFAITVIPNHVLTAQGQTTPTPAPSKTPVTTTTQETEEPTVPDTSTVESGGITPKTQADLQILTGNVQRPNGFVWHAGKLYTACTGDWTLYEIDAETGTTAQYIYGVKNAHTMLATPENDELSLWVPDFQSNNVVKLSNRGTPQIIATDIQSPWGITPLNDETVGVTSLADNTFIRITPTGETTNLITGLRSPTGVASNDKFIYVANTGSSRRAIEWYDKEVILNREEPLDSSRDTTHTLVSGIQNVTNITLASDGYLYFAYSLGTRGVVGRVQPQICQEKGGCDSTEVEIVVYTELAAPLAGVTISPDMKLYIHSMFSPDIYWIQLENSEAN